jgi:hypothetical protein
MYELGTSAGAIRRLRLEIVSVEILQHAFFCLSASIYDMKFGMNFWTNVTLLYQY